MSTDNAIDTLIESWETFYNEDAARMVSECYAADCEVFAMGLQAIKGRRELQRVEDIVLAKAPNRRLSVTRHHVCGDTVCVEATLNDRDQGADWELPFVAVLTVRDGQIVTDRTYADWSRWPGLQ